MIFGIFVFYDTNFSKPITQNNIISTIPFYNILSAKSINFVITL